MKSDKPSWLRIVVGALFVGLACAITVALMHRFIDETGWDWGAAAGVGAGPFIGLIAVGAAQRRGWLLAKNRRREGN